jgi:hypothetical protein
MKPRYVGVEKVIHEALVASRGNRSSNAARIAALEHKLETSRLTPAEINDIRRQIQNLRGG